MSNKSKRPDLEGPATSNRGEDHKKTPSKGSGRADGNRRVKRAGRRDKEPELKDTKNVKFTKVIFEEKRLGLNLSLGEEDSLVFVSSIALGGEASRKGVGVKDVLRRAFGRTFKEHGINTSQWVRLQKMLMESDRPLELVFERNLRRLLGEHVDDPTVFHLRFRQQKLGIHFRHNKSGSVYVHHVEPGSEAAQRKKLKPNDLLCSINGTEITHGRDLTSEAWTTLKKCLRNTPRPLDLVFQRDAEHRHILRVALRRRNKSFGILLQRDSDGCTFVLGVVQGSQADRRGVLVRDVLRRVNDIPLNQSRVSNSTFRRIIHEVMYGPEGDQLQLVFTREKDPEVHSALALTHDKHQNQVYGCTHHDPNLFLHEAIGDDDPDNIHMLQLNSEPTSEFNTESSQLAYLTIKDSLEAKAGLGLLLTLSRRRDIVVHQVSCPPAFLPNLSFSPSRLPTLTDKTNFTKSIESLKMHASYPCISPPGRSSMAPSLNRQAYCVVMYYTV
jgi:hypothetical protein